MPSANAELVAGFTDELALAAAIVSVRLASMTKKAPLNVQQYAHEHGVSSDGCQTMADVKNRVDMMRTIARGYQSRAILIPHRVLK